MTLLTLVNYLIGRVAPPDREAVEGHRMTLLTLGKYLFGNREAILQVARSPGALGVGLLFVLAAGFAREYDGEDLLAEPWHVLIPLGASVVSAAMLYGLVRLGAFRRDATEPSLGQGYLDFLTLYWMTAPLALLYAIPFERFLSAGDATRANLWLLGLVAAWRVVLIARVISVIYRASFLSALFLVMLFADTLAVVILGMTPLPIVGFMGGIRLSESEEMLHSVGWTIRVLGVLTWPVWFILTCLVLAGRGNEWRYLPAENGGSVRVARHLWLAAGAAVAAWAFILPFTQPEQQLRSQVERDLRAGRIDEALQTMSAHQPGDFPPHWDPPPRLAYRESKPDILELQEHLNTTSVAPWVSAIYAEKFGNALRGEDTYSGVWMHLPADELERRIAIVETMPNRIEIVKEHESPLKWIADDDDPYGYASAPQEHTYPEPLRERIRALLVEAGALPQPPEPQEQPIDADVGTAALTPTP